MYPPQRRAIVVCDFDMGGFRPPEMVKRRPAVVLNERLPGRDNLANVVPLSGTPPPKGCDYQCMIELPKLPTPFDGDTRWWVKADMIATVSYARLDLLRTERDPATGKRRYLTIKVTTDQFNDIKATLLRALRFDR